MQGTPISPCCVCGTRESTPFKYLLQCSQCRRGYHHRCCKPPVHDAVLTSLIRATEKKKPGKGLSAWVCMSCSAGGGSQRVLGREPSSSSTVASAINAVSETERRKQASAYTEEPEIISIIDSDDGEPEAGVPPTTKEKTLPLPEGSDDEGINQTRDSRRSASSGEATQISEESYDDMNIDHPQVPVPDPSVPISRSRLPPQRTSSVINVHTRSITRAPSSEARNKMSSRWASPSIPPQSRPVMPPSLHFPASSGFVSMKTFATWPKVARSLQVKIVNDESKLPFDDKKVEDLSRLPTPSKVQGRLPRKALAKKLDRYNKSPGQRAFTFITED